MRPHLSNLWGSDATDNSSLFLFSILLKQNNKAEYSLAVSFVDCSVGTLTELLEFNVSFGFPER